MISKPTVLILGAGASAPYGFPTGKKLVEDVLKFNASGSHIWSLSLSEIKKELNIYDGPDLKDFKNSLKLSGRNSVDAFLESRPEFLIVGKALIAYFIFIYEFDSKEQIFNTNDDNLYRYLVEFLYKYAKNYTEFKKNKLSILTFNYDRSLEYFLYNAIRNNYSSKSDPIGSPLESIPIVHLHGSLGSLNDVDFGSEKMSINMNEMVNPKDKKNIKDNIKKAVENIIVIHENENIDKYPQFEKARKLIDEAQRIYFLGFGYDPINMKRLGLQKLITHKLYFGSAYGLTEKEKDEIKRSHKNDYHPALNTFDLTLGESGHKCVEFLRTVEPLGPEILR